MERVGEFGVTEFEDKVDILGDMFSNHRNDEIFKNFAIANDIGLPLAYLIREGLCEVTDEGELYISQTWDLFIKFLGLEDIGYGDLDDVFQVLRRRNTL